MLNREETQNRIDRFPTRCRQAGLKVTPQRIAVYNMLASTESHPTPEAIYSAVRPDLPSISLGTVYKILDQLNAKGMLRKIATADQAARYDARVDTHHHSICTACGRVDDVELDEGMSQEMGFLSPEGFHADQIDILMHGTCGDCLRAN